MKIVYLSNYFNHHQKFLSDALYEATSHNYLFVETKELPTDKKKLGYTEYHEPYVVKYNEDARNQIDAAIIEADAVICGEAPSSLVRERTKRGLLTFRDDERRYRSLIKYLKWPIYTYHSFTFNKGYLLCASAFAARDYMLSGMNPNKCFRWGYFPQVRIYDNIDSLFERKKNELKHPKGVSILWAGRLIGLKHPEMAISLAEVLKEKGLPFTLQIIGQGTLANELKSLIEKKELNECVHMLGSMPQEKVREAMERSDVFLFTSDQNEGWGAVLNESMNSGCAVVASHAIGAVPYLIKDGENGMIFRSEDNNSLVEKVTWLIEHPEKRTKMGVKAYLTMKDSWNAETACNNLLELIKSLKSGKETPFIEGPCSKAPLMNHNWM